jgi:hypothetical protein
VQNAMVLVLSNMYEFLSHLQNISPGHCRATQRSHMDAISKGWQRQSGVPERYSMARNRWPSRCTLTTRKDAAPPSPWPPSKQSSMYSVPDRGRCSAGGRRTRGDVPAGYMGSWTASELPPLQRRRQPLRAVVPEARATPGRAPGA